MWRFLPALVFPLWLAACLTPPATLRNGGLEPIGVAEAQRRNVVGVRVRWGGTIVTTTPGKAETCFEIVSRRLDRRARPVRTDDTDGRFIACAPGFYDPEVYAQGRELTVIGTLRAPVERKIGEYEYRYPLVAAENVYLWPKEDRELVYYDPWLGPWDPFWGPWPYRGRGVFWW